MVTINPKLEALTKDTAQSISEEYLRGLRDLEHVYGFRLRGLNNKLKLFGLPTVNTDKSIEYRIFYVKMNYSPEEIETELKKYLLTHRMGEQRDKGIELFNCRFGGKDYTKCFNGIIGKKRFNELSEDARLQKIDETDQKIYGGVGLAGEQTLKNSQKN